MTKPIIFREGIVCLPSESLAIRSVCLYVSTFVKEDAEFLLETHKHNKDIYYKWIKQIHLTDFITELIEVEEDVLEKMSDDLRSDLENDKSSRSDWEKAYVDGI